MMLDEELDLVAELMESTGIPDPDEDPEGYQGAHRAALAAAGVLSSDEVVA